MERPQLIQYKLNEGVGAPNALNFTGTEFKSYKKGDLIVGYVYENPDPEVKLAPQIIAEGEWIIPLNKLTKVKEVSYEEAEKLDAEKGVVDLLAGKKEETHPETVSETVVKEMKDEVDKISKSNIVHDVMRKSRGSVNGMLIGGGIGLLIGVVSKKSLFVTTVLGATIGGFLAVKIFVRDPSTIKKTQTPEIAKP
jgi:hypothetical protein